MWETEPVSPYTVTTGSVSPSKAWLRPRQMPAPREGNRWRFTPLFWVVFSNLCAVKTCLKKLIPCNSSCSLSPHFPLLLAGFRAACFSPLCSIIGMPMPTCKACPRKAGYTRGQFFLIQLIPEGLGRQFPGCSGYIFPYFITDAWMWT